MEMYKQDTQVVFPEEDFDQVELQTISDESRHSSTTGPRAHHKWKQNSRSSWLGKGKQSQWSTASPLGESSSCLKVQG